MDTKQVTPEERKMKILAAAHEFTEEMDALGIKYAAVVYDETLQVDDRIQMYSVGNVSQPLVDWLVATYSELRGRSEVVEYAHVRSDENQLPA
jgi:hypothetical protein